jgi:hypothetical protein
MTQFTCKGVKQINNRISLNMTFIFTIRISRRFSSAREFQMGNFQKYWSPNVGQDFIVLGFFSRRKILKVDGRDGRDPQNREKNAPAGRFTCMPCICSRSTSIYILSWIIYITFLFFAISCTISISTVVTVAVLYWLPENSSLLPLSLQSRYIIYSGHLIWFCTHVYLIIYHPFSTVVICFFKSITCIFKIVKMYKGFTSIQKYW